MQITKERLIAENIGEEIAIIRKLGEGGQGIVYLIESPSYGRKALKWYNAEQSTVEQLEAIRSLIHYGPPKGESGKRFVWPLDVVMSEHGRQFGYLMDLIDTAQFAELGEVWANKKPVPTMKALCLISHAAADSYRKLHLNGFCYRDISAGNIMFNPKTGEVLICDNDNIGVENESVAQVWGTMEYMAPEIICKGASPSSDTDLYSLAVLLFHQWIWHHPMHGMMEYNIRSWDLPAKRKIYGENPVFIFHPTDHSNCLPQDDGYQTAQRRWDVCPQPLKEKFIQAFTVGLHDPKQRVTEGEWRKLFMELHDCIFTCSHDSAENFWVEGVATPTCWYCKQNITAPPRLLLQDHFGKRYFLLDRQAVLRNRHINPIVEEGQEKEEAGILVQNPNNPDVWGLRNLTTSVWTAVFPNGTKKEIPPQRAVPLQVGLQIQFGRAVGIIQG